MHTTIGQDGFIQLPSFLLSDIGIKPGSALTLSVRKNSIILTPDSSRKKDKSKTNKALEAFLQLCEAPSNNPVDIDAAIGQAVLDNDRY